MITAPWGSSRPVTTPERDQRAVLGATDHDWRGPWGSSPAPRAPCSMTGASAGAQLGRDPSLGAIEHRERPGDRLRLAARVVQRGTVEHLDLVLRRRARNWDEAT